MDGELSIGKAAKIGASGLSEEDMIRVAQMGENMSDRGLAELVEMAKTAPKVESDQGVLFGSALIDTMTIKAELAGQVRAMLRSNQRILSGAAKKKRLPCWQRLAPR